MTVSFRPPRVKKPLLMSVEVQFSSPITLIMSSLIWYTSLWSDGQFCLSPDERDEGPRILSLVKACGEMFRRDGAIVAWQSARTPGRITPYPTGRLSCGGVVPGTSCQGYDRTVPPGHFATVYPIFETLHSAFSKSIYLRVS